MSFPSAVAERCRTGALGAGVILAIACGSPKPTTSSVTPAEPVLTEKEVDAPARILSMPTPRYPSELQEQGISGWVDFEYIIGADGRVEPSSIRAFAFSNPAFIRPATRSLTGATFVPARKEKRAVRMVHRQRISFTVQRT